MLGLDVTRDLSPARAASLTEYINNRVKEGWEFDWWDEWTPVELRQYRAPWSALTAYTAPVSPYVVGSGPVAATEVGFPTPSGWMYFQALQPSTNQPPVDPTGAVFNTEYWAQSFADYTGINWAPGFGQLLADQVFDPATQQYYQCYIAHTTGASMDYTKYGVLTPFDRYVGYCQPGKTPLGRIEGVYLRDPNVATRNPGKIPWRKSTLGVQVNIRAPGQVYVKFSLREPVFTTVPYSSTFAYTGAGELVYVAGPLNANATGNCYTSIKAGTGQSPTAVNSTYWALVQFPLVLSNFVKRAALSDALRDLKQQDRAALEEERAKQELSDAVDREIQSQSGSERASAQTYGSGL